MRRSGARLVMTAVTALSACRASDGAMAPAGPGAPDVVGGTPIGLLDGDYRLRGITSDGWLVYHDRTAWFALDPAARMPAPVRLADYGARDTDVRIDGHVAFISTEVNASGVGTLSIWSSAAPASPPRRATAAHRVMVSRASPDGSTVAYVGNVSSDGKIGDFVLDDVAGTRPVTLLAQV